MKKIQLIMAPLMLLLLSGCEDKVASSIGKIHWDRDMCTRCVMVVSDRHNTVQLKDPNTNKQHVFDDIGCMAIWFHTTKPSFKDSVEIWVNDASSGEFIDARTAFYTTQNVTPMSFGFSAYKTKEGLKEDAEIINYDEVINRCLDRLK